MNKLRIKYKIKSMHECRQLQENMMKIFDLVFNIVSRLRINNLQFLIFNSVSIDNVFKKTLGNFKFLRRDTTNRIQKVLIISLILNCQECAILLQFPTKRKQDFHHKNPQHSHKHTSKSVKRFIPFLWKFLQAATCYHLALYISSSRLDLLGSRCAPKIEFKHSIASP